MYMAHSAEALEAIARRKQKKGVPLIRRRNGGGDPFPPYV
jgi:hypothetical protein